VKRFPNFHNVALLAAAACLSACSMFSSRSDYYTKAAESRPLEVPPDLDTPASANELVVPNAGAGAANAAAAVPSAPVPARAELHVDGGVLETWKSVGSALQRSKLGTVTGRDEATHSYAFDFDAEAESQSSDGHWFSAVLHHLGFGEGEHIKHPITVSVSEDAGGSRISVDGNGTDRSATYAAQRTGRELAGSVSGATALAPVAAAPAAAPVPASAPPSAAMPAPAPAPMAPAAAASVSSAPPAIGGVSVAGNDLHVADTVANTWQRVGLAIERAQIGTLSARDEASHTYTLAFDSTVEAPAAESEHHWYTRILHPFGGGKGNAGKVARTLTVRVSDDAGGARVSVEGDMSDKASAEAAQRVVQVLRDRLS